jgi:hypothetical protein
VRWARKSRLSCQICRMIKKQKNKNRNKTNVTIAARKKENLSRV